MSIYGVVIGQKKVSETATVKECTARKYYLQVDIVHMNNSPEVDLYTMYNSSLPEFSLN